MGIREGEFVFKLRKPLDYKFDGTNHQADHVILKEPGMEHQKFYVRLEQMLMRGQLEMSERAGQIKETVGEVVKPFTEQVDTLESQMEEVYQMYTMCVKASQAVDAWEFQNTFEKMACSIARKGVVMIDGRKSMVAAHWNNLVPKDAFEMAVRWCAFFAMPSIEGEKTTSEPQPESPTELTVA